MQPNDELTGVMVLIHPELPVDPASRQGQVGRITSSELEKDNVFVGFGAGQQALYSADALLVFKPTAEIYAILESRKELMSKDHFDKLFKINLLQQFGMTPAVRNAMKLAASDKVVRDLAMDSLQNQLSYQIQIRETYRLDR